MSQQTTHRVSEERETDARAVLEAGQAVDLGDGYVSVPFQIASLHARIRVSSSSGGPLIDATGAADVIPVGFGRVNIKLKKQEYVDGNPAILGQILRQLQWQLRDGIEIKGLSLAEKSKVSPNLKIS